MFPRLRTIEATTTSDGPAVTVTFTKQGGAPVTYIAADDPTQAAAVRQVDLQNKFHWSATELVEKLGITAPRGTALRRHLGIDGDPDCCYEFEFGKASHVRYSDNAFKKMQDALADGVDMDAVWEQYGPKRGSRQQGSEKVQG